MSTPPLLLCYLRKSVLKNDDPTASPERQREAIARIAPPGWEIRWYQDLNYSGSTSERPDWQRLLADLQNYSLNIGGVAAESLSRLYRNRSEFEILKRLIAQRDCELLLANMQGVDGRRASGRLLLNIQSDVDQFWSEQSSESMRETIQVIQAAGRHWGTQPFGTDRDPGTKHLIPSTRWYWYDAQRGQAWRFDDLPTPPDCEQRFYFDGLKAMFEIYSSGKFSFQDVTEALTAAGWYFWSRDLITPQPFTRQTVRSILQRASLYAAEALAGRNTSPQRQRAGLGASHQPILPVELCQAVEAVYSRRSKEKPQGHSNQSEHVYLLTGVVYCGVCGQRLCGQRQHKTPQQWFYRHLYSKGDCPERLAPAEALEGEIIAALIEIVKMSPVLFEIIEGLRKDLILAAQPEGDNTQPLLEQKQTEMARLVELYTRGIVDLTIYERQYEALRAEIAELKQKQKAWQLPDDLEQTIAEVLVFVPFLHEGEPELLRDVITNFFTRIEVKQKQIYRVELHEWAAPLAEYCGLTTEGWLGTQPTILIIAAWLNVPA